MTPLKKALIVAAVILGGLVLLAFIWALKLGYFPALGESIGFGGAKDLGITYSDEDYANAKDKFDEAAEAEMVKQTFTDAEITALMNSCTQSACVINDAQVRTSDDGLVEISGTIDRDEVAALFESAIASSEDPSGLAGMINYLPPQPAFYIKTEMVGENDVFVLELERAQIAGINIPNGDLDELSAELTKAITDYLASLTGTQVNDLNVTDEGIFIDANLAEFNAEDLGT